MAEKIISLDNLTQYNTKVQEQFNIKVNKSGDTVTGSLQVDGALTLPNSPTTPEETTVTEAYTTRVTGGGTHTVVDGDTAIIEMIKGSTVKSANLIPYPYFDFSKNNTNSYTHNGITYTLLNDGGIYAKGTSTTKHSYCGLIDYFDMGTEIVVYPVQTSNTNGSYCLSKTGSVANKLILAYDSSNKSVWLRAEPNTTVDGVVYPMLNEGTTALPFRPYFTGLKHAYIDSIKSTGRNLIDHSTYTEMPATYSGVTFTKNADGSVRVKGLCNGDNFVLLTERLNLYPNYQYTFSGYQGDSDGDSRLHIDFGYSNSYDDFGYGGTFVVPTNYNQMRLYFRISNGVTYDTTLYPMLNHGTTALPYEPYVKDTFILPETLELGEWDSYNPQTGELTVGTRTIAFDGTTKKLTYAIDKSTYYSYALTLPSTYLISGAQSIVASNNFEVNWGTSGKVKGTIATQGNTSALTELNIWFNKTAFTEADVSTLELANAYLKKLYDEGKPLTIAYRLKTPTVIKLQDIPKRFYTAWNGGSETQVQGEMDNSADGAIPTITQTYQIIENGNEAANKAYVRNGLAKKLDKTGGTITGNLIVEGKTNTELGAIVSRKGNDTYGLALDEDAYKLGKGTVDDNGNFTFNENEGLPIALRDDSESFTDGHLIKWNSDGNKISPTELVVPETGGTVATQEYVQENALIKNSETANVNDYVLLDALRFYSSTQGFNGYIGMYEYGTSGSLEFSDSNGVSTIYANRINWNDHNGDGADYELRFDRTKSGYIATVEEVEEVKEDLPTIERWG